MASKIAEATDPKPYDDIEIHAMPRGGYVIQPARGFDPDSDRYCLRQPIAAFSTLAEMLKWLGSNTRCREKEGG